MDEILSKENVIIGNELTFGRYQQSGDTAADKEAIQWLVLARDNGKVLLLSKYGLDIQPYHSIYDDMTWEYCDVRQWLNTYFFNTAFTPKEREAILVTKVDNSPEQGCREYETDSGNDTEDKVFFLSHKEAFDDYVVDDVLRTCKPTEYALKRGVDTNMEGNCWWWLRSSGYCQCDAACVSSDGLPSNSDISIDDNCIRPSLWVNLSKF